MKLWKRLFVPSCILLSMLTFVYLLPENSFWCMDEGNRYLQTWSLSHGLHLPPELPYPGSERISDPELVETLKPLPAHFGYLLGRCELYSQYNPLLALTAVPSHMLLGQRGIYIPCILAGAILA